MAINNNVGGMMGSNVPTWLEDWLIEIGALDVDTAYSLNDSDLNNTNPYGESGVDYSPPVTKVSDMSLAEQLESGGWTPAKETLNSNQLTTPNMQQVGSNIVGGVMQNLGSLTGVPALNFAPEVIDYSKKAYDYVTDPSGPSSIGEIGSGLWDGAVSLYDDVAREVNSFMDNPVQKTANALGFRTGEEAGVYSNVGLAASNIGTAAEKSTPLTGLFGTLAAGGAGLFETKQLNEAMGRKGKTADGLFETWEGVPEEDQLGFWDQMNAWLTPNSLNSIATDRFSYANSPENFTNFPGAVPSLTPTQAFYNAQAASAGGNWTGESISNPNAANNPYGPQWGGFRTAMTPEEVPAVFARANNIAAQQAAAKAAVATESQNANPNTGYLASLVDASSGGGWSGDDGGGWGDEGDSYGDD
jgi:hypothetical protein